MAALRRSDSIIIYHRAIITQLQSMDITSIYQVNDLVFYRPRNKEKDIIGRVLQIKQHKVTKEFYLILCPEYDPLEKRDIILEDDVIRALPLRENRNYHININKHKNFVQQIQGYPRRILLECDRAGIEKEFVIPRSYKDVEFKNMYYSHEDITVFSHETYHHFFNSFKDYNPTNILNLGCGDIRILFDIFIDFNQFKKLKRFKVIEVDITKYLKIEAMFDKLVKILKTNWNLDRFNEYFYAKKYYAKHAYKADYAVPIKMILTHKPSNRSIIFYRQCLWDVLQIETSTNKKIKYQLICNWLNFTNDEYDKLLQQILKPKISKKNCIMITIQKLSKMSQRELLMYKCGKLDIFNPTQTVHAYTKCECH